MRQLSKRTGPKLDFIIRAHRLAFEQQIIGLYIDAVEQSQEFHLPDLREDLVLTGNPMYFLAAIQAEETEDEGYFDQITNNLSEEELFEYVGVELDLLQGDPMFGQYRYLDYQDKYADEAEKVLNFHHMCFADFLYDIRGELIPGDYVRNLPMKEVW